MGIFAAFIPKFMAKEFLNWSNISLLLTGRTDIIRENRIPKKYLEQVNELLIIIEYWQTKHKK